MLIDLLSLPERPLISIVGAGGKTTTMYTLAREMAERDQRVLTTTTTHIFFPEKSQTDAFVMAEHPLTLLHTVQSISARYRRITAVSHITEAGKLAGVRPDQPYELLTKTDAAAVIVEADGARGRLIKAPADHEPVIPSQSNVVLIMMSVAAINQPLNDTVAHRPEHIAALLNMAQGDILTPERVARLVASEQGGMKNIPAQAQVYLLVTGVAEEKQKIVQQVSDLLRSVPRLADVLRSDEIGVWWRN